MKKVALAIGLFGVIALAGCASHPKRTANQAPPPASGAATTGTQGTGIGPGSAIGGQQPQAGPKSAYESRVIYFDTNQSVIKPEFFSVLKDQAEYLSAHPNQKVMLEGYCDERGTREYNLGLGSRRAAAVRKFLLLQGVNADQLETISYGEAYPADSGHDPAAWSKNRRVVLNFHPDEGRSGLQSGNP
ncbi:MAG: peptidoglycan-associated lipoprotein Pal [Gammaproteobacteria bacterium]